MKFCHLNIALSAAVVSFLCGIDNVAKAQEPDYTCFITTASGQIVDLSHSLCGSQSSAPTLPVNSDQAFVEDYKRSLDQYPEVRDSLLADNQQSAEPNIRKAKSVCEKLKAGRSLSEIKQAQTEESVERTSVVKAEIIDALATKHYCPEFSN